MLKADFVAKLTQPIADMYEALNVRLVEYIVNKIIGKNGKGIKYAIEHSANLGAINYESAAIIDEVTKKANARLKQVVMDAVFAALWNNGNGTEITGGVEKTIEAVIRQASDDLNLVNTIMKAGTLDKATGVLQRLTDAQYRGLSVGAMEAVTGTTTMTQTITDTIRGLAESGIDAFVDAAGRHWSPEGYVSMDIRTTVHNAALGAIREQGKDLGLTVILVSSHAGARPQCAPYQGKCYSMDGSYGTITDAHGRKYDYEPIENTTYKKEPAGLFGINCGHSFRYIEDGGFVNREQTIESAREEQINKEKYLNEQQARGIERKVRKYKEIASAMNVGQQGSGARYSALAEKWTEVYNAFCHANNIHTMPDRLELLR